MKILWACLTAVATWPTLGPEKVAAQATGDQPIYACYIPVVGVVYRIKAPGLPTSCLAKTHIQFQWNQVGPKGETGIAGNLALAGQSCASGSFLTGFSSDGTLVCDQGATSGPNPLIGDWQVRTPAIGICVETGFLYVFPGSMQVGSPAAGQLVLGFTVAILGISANVQVPVAVPNPLAFPFSVASQGTTPIQGGGLTGTMSWSMDGHFDNSTTFTGHFQVTPNITFEGRQINCGSAIGGGTFGR